MGHRTEKTAKRMHEMSRKEKQRMHRIAQPSPVLSKLVKIEIRPGFTVYGKQGCNAVRVRKKWEDHFANFMGKVNPLSRRILT